MEMPKGWKKLNSFTKAEIFADASIDEALDLMKEMARALEQHVETCGTGFKHEDILKRFREWK